MVLVNDRAATAFKVTIMVDIAHFSRSIIAANAGFTDVYNS